MPNILLIEDDEANRLFMESVLHQHGHAVTAVGNGRDALAALQRSVPDIVVLDIVLPDMGGPTVARHIRTGPHDRRATPILAVTAFAMRDEIENIMRHGMDRCLIKPFTGEELLQAVHLLLGV